MYTVTLSSNSPRAVQISDMFCQEYRTIADKPFTTSSFWWYRWLFLHCSDGDTFHPNRQIHTSVVFQSFWMVSFASGYTFMTSKLAQFFKGQCHLISNKHVLLWGLSTCQPDYIYGCFCFAIVHHRMEKGHGDTDYGYPSYQWTILCDCSLVTSLVA